MKVKKHSFSRRISFYETDAMGIVHHSNYLRLLEDARVDWIRGTKDFNETPLNTHNFPVLKVDIEYLSPLKFDDLAQVILTAKLEKSKLKFNYEVFVNAKLKTNASTVHAVWDNQKNTVVRPPPFLVAFINS